MYATTASTGLSRRAGQRHVRHELPPVRLDLDPAQASLDPLL
jgi:hypothetical protein